MAPPQSEIIRNQSRHLLKLLIGRKDDWRLHRPAPANSPNVGLSWTGPTLLIVATAASWFALKDAVGDEGNVAFALFIGAVSILLMGWSNLLSTRARFLEPFFGGLDRMYRWHRWFGVLSVAAMWYHVQTIDDVRGIAGASKSVADSAEDLAGTGETLLYILVLVSLLRWIPYKWWKWTHKLMILPYVFACWHFHTSTKPYANSDPWGRWFQALMLLGVFAWIYRVIWRDIFNRGQKYVVTALDNSAGITTLEMSPVARPVKYEIGQFVFLSVGEKRLSESHPFTIASHPDEPVLRVYIKELGDWSNKIGNVATVGDAVIVEGPYGRLPLFPRGNSTVLWIAGGVGITPFLGALRDKQIVQFTPHLFYAVRKREEAVGLDELMRAHSDGRLILHLFVSEEGTRLCDVDIVETIGVNGLVDSHVVMCGPDSLISSMTQTVRTMGCRYVHHEAFDIRTGLGPDLSEEIDQVMTKMLEKKSDRRAKVITK